MARKKRKMNVYYNSGTDTWSNDSNTQPYIKPGTGAYKAYSFDKDNNTEDDIVEDNVKEIDSKSEAVDHAYDVANRKFRRKMSKERQNSEVKTIISHGLGKSVNITGGLLSKVGLTPTNEDELYDDGISDKEYKKEVIRDYASDLAEVMHTADKDNDHDGDIDENDVIITPGMKTMAKYM